MKSFFKVFVTAFICFTLLLGCGTIGFMKFMASQNPFDDENQNREAILPKVPEKIKDNRTEIQKLIDDSKRINILLLGFEGPRTDTIMLTSFDPDNKLVDLIAIPRDTYCFDKKYKGTKYDTLGHKKINAAYIRGGVKETMDSVSKTLCDIPIDAYVGVTYKGVEKIVDSLGGVKVNIPMNMNYDDPLAKPQLHIRFTKGSKVLNGKQSIKYLRFRKNNDGTGYPDGDLGRIRAQQQFLKSAVNKSLSLRLPHVINTAFDFVKTDLDLKEIAYLADNAIGFKKENFQTYTLPGNATYENGTSYYHHDSKEVEKMLVQIYKQDRKEEN